MTFRLQHWIGAGTLAPTTVQANGTDGTGFETDPDYAALSDQDQTSATELAAAAGAIAQSWGATTVSVDATSDGGGTFLRVTPLQGISTPGGVEAPTDETVQPATTVAVDDQTEQASSGASTEATAAQLDDATTDGTPASSTDTTASTGG